MKVRYEINCINIPFSLFISFFCGTSSEANTPFFINLNYSLKQHHMWIASENITFLCCYFYLQSTHYLSVVSYDAAGLKLIFYIRIGPAKIISYERRDYEAVAGMQQFNTARTKVPSLVIQEETG